MSASRLFPHPLSTLSIEAGRGHPVWREIAPELTPEDFRDPERMDVGFLRLLSRARRRAGVPFRVISDHREASRNEEVGGALRSAHLELPCRAVDLWAETNEERFRIVEALLSAGFIRIGVYPARVSAAGTVHVDASSRNPAPRLWTRS